MWCVNRSAPFYYCPNSLFFVCGGVIGGRLITTVLFRCFCVWCGNWWSAFLRCPYSLFFVCGVLIGLRVFTTVLIRCFLCVAR